MRSIEELWNTIKDQNFDDPLDDATANEIRQRCDILRNGGSPTSADFSLDNKIAALGGIHDVRRTIERNWTIEELEDFLGGWMMGGTFETKKTLMAATKPRTTVDEVAEDRVYNLTTTLQSLYDSALLAIGAKCHADCKRSNTYLALGLDDRSYYRQTLADLEKTLPPPFVSMLKGIFADTTGIKRNLNKVLENQEAHGETLGEIKTAAEDNTTKLGTVECKLNETQAAANSAAKNSAHISETAKTLTETATNLSNATVEIKTAANIARTAAEKAANKPTTVVNAQPGSTVNIVRPPRTDKGTTHDKTARGWRTQQDVATDFSKSERRICGKWYGRVALDTVKDWETRYPNEGKKHPKCGYHAGLRKDRKPENKAAYWEAAGNWNDYWRQHNAAFSEWLQKHPNGDRKTFLKKWKPGKTIHRSDTDKTLRYGADTSLSDSLDSGGFDDNMT